MYNSLNYVHPQVFDSFSIANFITGQREIHKQDTNWEHKQKPTFPTGASVTICAISHIHPEAVSIHQTNATHNNPCNVAPISAACSAIGFSDGQWPSAHWTDHNHEHKTSWYPVWVLGGLLTFLPTSILSFSLTQCLGEISGFCREVDKKCALLGQITQRTQDSWSSEMGPTGCPVTTVWNHHYTLRNTPEERRRPNA
jgi:hypothetical protein